MRTMTHNSRTNASGRVHGRKHNDRNFDISKAENIDEKRVKNDIFVNCYNDKTMTFDEVEVKYYTENFGAQLKKTNDNYIKNRHPERCKTMEQFMQTRQYAPEETVMQIGKMEKHVDRDTFVACMRDYWSFLLTWNKDHGEPFQILNMAVHADEAVPHAQIRRVWKYVDESGTLRIGQEKALKAAGIELPNPDAKEGKHNNRKMTFDAMMREKWLDICQEHGIEVEREPVPDAKHNRDKEEMLRDKFENMIAVTRENETLLADQRELIVDQRGIIDAQQAEIDEKRDFLDAIPEDWVAYEEESQRAWSLLNALRDLMREIFSSGWIFRNRKGEQKLLDAVETTRDSIMTTLTAMRAFEMAHSLSEQQQRSRSVVAALDSMIQNAEQAAPQKELNSPNRSRKGQDPFERG